RRTEACSTNGRAANPATTASANSSGHATAYQASRSGGSTPPWRAAASRSPSWFQGRSKEGTSVSSVPAALPTAARAAAEAGSSDSSAPGSYGNPRPGMNFTSMIASGIANLLGHQHIEAQVRYRTGQQRQPFGLKPQHRPAIRIARQAPASN